MTASIHIGDYQIGEGKPCFLVAEIGINHNGDIAMAKKLIGIAHEVGFDAVKFQKRNPDIAVPDHQKAIPRETPWGVLSYLDYKKKIEFSEEQYKEIDEFCRDRGILWFASAWDTESVDFLEKFSIPCYKIPSACLTDDNLLKYIRSKGKPVILSTGMSTIEEIDHAVEILRDTLLVVLHCTSTYPCATEELNLKCIDTLRERYKKPTGYSGHEPGIMPSVVAVAAHGACVVERHITLNRSMWGTDQAASLEKRGMELLVRDIRMVPVMGGDGVKQVYDSELPIKKKLRL